jgi:hypothetical protein
MLDKKQMTLSELLGLLANYGEIPPGFDAMIAMHRRGPVDGPALLYHEQGATLTVYAEEPLPPSTHAPGAPLPTMPSRGPSPPRLLRATLLIPADYQLAWTVERLRDGTTDRWLPR